MWVYEQATGRLSHNGELIGMGYSGFGPDENVPEDQNVEGLGPIPQGLYTIGEPIDTETHGPFVLPLTPDAADEEFGRSGFLIHGNNMEHPGQASHGCIVVARPIREAIAASGDNRLQVVEGRSET